MTACQATVIYLVVTMWIYLANGSFFYIDNDHGQTVSAGRIDRRQKEELRQEVLGLLGLHNQPDSNPNHQLMQSASEFMQNLYKSIEDADSEKVPVDTAHIHLSATMDSRVLGLDPAKVEGTGAIVSFINNVQKASKLRRAHDLTFYFDVPSGEHIRTAELRIFKEVSPVLQHGRFTVSLYVIKPGQDRRERVLGLESTLVLEWDSAGWFTLDATTAATNWSSQPHLNMGLYLRVVDATGKLHDPEEIGIVGRKGPADRQAFLVGYMDESRDLLPRRSALRRKRWADGNGKSYPSHPFSERETEAPGSQDKCQRHKLYINFRDIGFDQKFLISPDGYSAFYCSGKCLFPLDKGMNASNHAIVQTLIHLMDPDLVPIACCVPDQYGAMPVLYFDNSNTLVIKNIPNMVVKTCGCF